MVRLFTDHTGCSDFLKSAMKIIDAAFVQWDEALLKAGFDGDLYEAADVFQTCCVERNDIEVRNDAWLC